MLSHQSKESDESGEGDADQGPAEEAGQETTSLGEAEQGEQGQGSRQAWQAD